MEEKIPLTEASFYILLAVYKPNHGYGIIGEVSAMTRERVQMGPGTLYGAINSMLARGLIRLYSEDKESRKKKEYLITEKGRQILAQEVIRLQELLKNAEEIMREGQEIKNG